MKLLMLNIEHEEEEEKEEEGEHNISFFPQQCTLKKKNTVIAN